MPRVERCFCRICYPDSKSLVVTHHSTNTHYPRTSKHGLQHIVWYLHVESSLPLIRFGAPTLLDMVVTNSGWKLWPQTPKTVRSLALLRCGPSLWLHIHL
jgi:hypothetical protein